MFIAVIMVVVIGVVAAPTSLAETDPCRGSAECTACRAAGFKEATARSHRAHRAWVDVRERYEMLGASEGHDHAFNLLIADKDGAASICNVSRGSCKGRDGGCTLGIGGCSGKKTNETCHVGESCTGEWASRVEGDWVRVDATAEARAFSFRPIDCDCAKSRAGQPGLVRVGFRGGRQVVDERRSIEQNMLGRVGNPGSIMSKRFDVKAGEETAIACLGVRRDLLGTIPDRNQSPPVEPPSTQPAPTPPTSQPPPSSPSQPPKAPRSCPAPEPHYKLVENVCVPSCGAAGGNVCNDAAACAGQPRLRSWDCTVCCARGEQPPPEPEPAPRKRPRDPPKSEPAEPQQCPAPDPHYKLIGGKCVPSCGAAGGNSCDAAACKGRPNLKSYDCNICCAR